VAEAELEKSNGQPTTKDFSDIHLFLSKGSYSLQGQAMDRFVELKQMCLRLSQPSKPEPKSEDKT